uniref:Uncharacterized protein n=1 Tax=Arundo donax TaxID=35708 RepID=A0A0A9CPM2_ARUDO
MCADAPSGRSLCIHGSSCQVNISCPQGLAVAELLSIAGVQSFVMPSIWFHLIELAR